MTDLAASEASIFNPEFWALKRVLRHG